MVVSKTGIVFHSKKDNSHEAIIKEFNLNDIKIFPDICRVEIVPKDKANVSRQKLDWVFKIDQTEKPDWFNDKHEQACWVAWEKIVEEQLALDGENKKVKDYFILAVGNSTVKAWGNSTVKAFNNSTVKAWGNSTVEAWGNNTVEAFDNSTVEAFDNNTVKAFDNSTVEAWGNNTVEAFDNSTVEAWGNNTVEAFDNSTVKACANFSVVKIFSNLVKFSITAGVIIHFEKNQIILPKNSKLKTKKIEVDTK